MPRQYDRGNQFLAHLSATDFAYLQPSLKPVELHVEEVLYEENAPLDYSYFPTSAVLSAVVVMDDGHMIEVATVGNEGAVGLPTFADAPQSPNRVFTQIPGAALRIETGKLSAASAESPAVKRLMGLHQEAFLYQVSRCVACNGLHGVELRCARWLLMTHDRVSSDTFALTHEFLAIMLGVRRATVSDILQGLKERGFIDYTRGKITVLDRVGLESAACECYSATQAQYARLLG
jgi:CRP-like cAMP-binding protein